MRLVLDTNVVVSALLWGGLPHRLIEAAAAGDIELVASPVLLAELRDVLGRGHLASRLAQQESTVDRAVAADAELVVVVSPLATPRVVAGDADDDHVIAAALAGGAQAIVSGDRDLLRLVSHQGVAILEVAETLRRTETAR